MNPFNAFFANLNQRIRLLGHSIKRSEQKDVGSCGELTNLYQVRCRGLQMDTAVCCTYGKRHSQCDSPVANNE